MTTIFDCETEIGKCDYEPDDVTSWHPESFVSVIYAHTLVCAHGNPTMLRVEHHCYLRNGNEMPNQPWIKPQLVLEPCVSSRAEMIARAKELHEQFVAQVHQQIPENYLVQ